MAERFRIDWHGPGGALVAIEPTLEEVRSHAAALAAAYNDPHNAPLLGHDEAIDEAGVVDHYEGLVAEGGRPFLLFRDGVLAGDADLRDIHDGEAEFAFLVAARAAQGKGLGTRFAVMIHTFAFERLRLRRIHVSVIPGNVASRRVFEKMGYTPHQPAAGSPFAGDAGDVTLAIDRATFERSHLAPPGEIRITAR